jgi:hypothetical protein
MAAELQVQRIYGVGANADTTNAADAQQIGQGKGQVALAADNDVLGGPGRDVVVAIPRQSICRSKRACPFSQAKAPWLNQGR